MEKRQIILPDKEWADWTVLVERGKKLREMSGGDVVDAKSGGMENRIRRGRKTDSVKKCPDGVRKWILCRHEGMSVKRATDSSGVSWGEIRTAYLNSEECRCAFDAMHEDSRHLMKELAYSAYEDALNGEEVTKNQIKAADRVLSSMETEHFGRPNERSGLITADGKVVGGGITIQLIDVSKGYVAPKAALIGDGEEGVTV